MSRFIVPCNPKYFDVIKHFECQKTLVCKRLNKVCVGDIVYVYLCQPYKEIKYRCHVTKETLDEQTIMQNKYAIINPSNSNDKYMEITLDFSYPTGAITYEMLKAHDYNQFQRMGHVWYKTEAFIDVVEANLSEDNL